MGSCMILFINECVMRKPDFCICENKDADQLRGNAKLICAFVFAAQMVQSLLFLKIRNFKPLAILCGCTDWFVSDLVGNPEDRFSHVAAQIIVHVQTRLILPLYCLVSSRACMIFPILLASYDKSAVCPFINLSNSSLFHSIR